MPHASQSATFKADHAAPDPGKVAPLTASRWPVILDLPPELKSGWPDYLPSRLSLALHMTGRVPFDDSDSPELSRGKRMEPVGEQILRERGYKILETQSRFAHFQMNALTYVDVVAVPPSEEKALIVEFKVVDDRDYRNVWSAGPPLYPLLQVQCQMACSPSERAQIGAIVLGYKSVDLILHDVERDEEIIAALEHRGREFLELLATATTEELTERLIEDDSADSYTAWSRVADLAKGSTAQLLEPEAVRRARRLHQARLDAKAADAVETAEKAWFAAHCPAAESIELLDGTVIQRKVVKTVAKAVPAHVKPARQHVTWSIKPAGEDDAQG